MISWATKIDFIGKLDDTLVETCKVCGQENKPIYNVEQVYFLLYWLPIFPTNRLIYKICPSCSFKSKLRNKQSNLIDDNSNSNLANINFHFPKKNKLKYFWGWIVYALIFALIGLFIFNFML
ncbi:MAG: hypothetical protein V4622_02485 [Bacteroidota bacterium]